LTVEGWDRLVSRVVSAGLVGLGVAVGHGLVGFVPILIDRSVLEGGSPAGVVFVLGVLAAVCAGQGLLGAVVYFTLAGRARWNGWPVVGALVVVLGVDGLLWAWALSRGA
jgi:hypothetical protein